MGCLLSSPQRVGPSSVSQQPKTDFTSTFQFGADSKTYVADIEFYEDAPSFFELLTGNVRFIRSPNGMVPPVCLVEEAIPLATSGLDLEDEQLNDIQLPVISISIKDDTRIACFAHILFLSPVCFDAEDTSRLITNILFWLNRSNPIDTPILLYCFPERYAEEAASSIEHQGYTVQNGDVDSDLSQHQIVLMPSHIDLTDAVHLKLQNYLSKGGGLGVFYSPDYDNPQPPVNKLLIDYGISYTYCTLSTNGFSRINVEIPSKFEVISRWHLMALAASFSNLTHQDDIAPADLDDLVTSLRYHVMLCDIRHRKIIEEIISNAWYFLENTDYINEEGIAHDITHSIAVLLINDLTEKLPPEDLKLPLAVTRIFPGETHDVVPEDHKLEIHLHDESWISTGLWLIADHIGSVICENPPKGLHVQVGSHCESLLTKQGPWKRWPGVISSFEVKNGKTKVGSAFGGIVYLFISYDDDEEIEELPATTKLTFQFNGFTKYPRAVFKKPKVYEATKKFDVPWGELTTNSLILTLPAVDLHRIQNVDEVCTRLDKLVMMISLFMGYQVARPYRVVFDVEKADDETYSCGYPIVILTESLEDIVFRTNELTPGLFILLRSIAIVSIPENTIDDPTEAAVATLAATAVFKEFNPAFDPFSFQGITLPPLFNELWVIHSQFSSTLIPNLLQQNQKPDAETYDSPEDMWIGFVRDLCNLAKYDLTKVLEQGRPLPVSLINTLSELPPIPIRLVY